MDIDKILENMVAGKYAYQGFLSTGIFGDRVNRFFLPEGNLAWWGILLIIIISILIDAFIEAVSEDELGLRLRCMAATMLLVAIFCGTNGIIFVGIVECWAVFQIIKVIGKWLE